MSNLIFKLGMLIIIIKLIKLVYKFQYLNFK